MRWQNESYIPFATVHEATLDGNVLHVYGDVDLNTAKYLEIDIDDAFLDGVSPLRIDFTECRYIDSSTLAVLIRARKKYGPKIQIDIGDNRGLHRIFKITGLDAMLLESHRRPNLHLIHSNAQPLP